MGFQGKIVSWGELPQWRERQRKEGRTVVATNGCFDLLHLGHATYLEAARSLGDVLVVGINSDTSVRALKGPSRPVNPESDRAALVAALGSVDAVCIFEDVSARAFLERVRPDIWAKGADYTLETVNGQERAVVEQAGGRIAFVDLVPGRSTTRTLQRLSTQPPARKPEQAGNQAS